MDNAGTLRLMQKKKKIQENYLKIKVLGNKKAIETNYREDKDRGQ